ncbi:MAG: Fic family protein [Bacteroidetes bacterium]|nr:Fic family protein [Bacteroidota bacterium]
MGNQIPAWLAALGSEPAEADLTYLVQASAVYSSNIEGNTVDLNSFMNSIASKTKFKPGKEVDEIKDLVAAYEFAKQQELTEKNFLAAHKTMNRTLLIKDKQGTYRTERMGVFDHTGMVYLAVEPEKVKAEMKLLFEDIGQLLRRALTDEEAFYHASLLHLRLAHIHPFWDGNGRMARLLEKWLLSKTLNGRAWALPSEKYYKEHLADYYRNIRLGMDFYDLDYGKSLPFLAMLPACMMPQS